MKRDLCKLIRLDKARDKAYSEVEKKKSVSVRPGLALGVITLQAGAAGARGLQQLNIEQPA